MSWLTTRKEEREKKAEPDHITIDHEKSCCKVSQFVLKVDRAEDNIVLVSLRTECLAR